MNSAAPGLLTTPVEMKETEVAVVHSVLAPSLQVSESQGSEDARNGTSPQEVVVLPISAFEAGFLPSKPGKCPVSILVTLLAIAHSKSVIDDDIRSNSHSAHNGHCPSSLHGIVLSFPYIYNHVQALVIGFDVISFRSGTFIASSGFPISPYCLSPCCMYFLLGVQSLMFFIWVNYDLSFFHNFWSHNLIYNYKLTAEVLVLAAGPVLHTLPHLTPPSPSSTFPSLKASCSHHFLLQ
ncbi:unnamed protein product [Sphagnum jensenii]